MACVCVCVKENAETFPVILVAKDGARSAAGPGKPDCEPVAVETCAFAVDGELKLDHEAVMGDWLY
jgi:hypothetical protein